MQTAIECPRVALGVSVDLVLSCATCLAREGQYESAERLLLTLPSQTITAPALDLLARIYAQQRRYTDAGVRWTEALQIDPSNREYKRCLQVAEREVSRLLWPRRVAMVVLILGLAITAAWVEHLWRARNLNASIHRTAKLSDDGPVSQPQRLAHESSAPKKSYVEIRPSHALFSKGTHFASTAKADLAQVTTRIRSLPPMSELRIEGHTDSEPVKTGGRFRSNEELAMARASAVAIILHRRSGLPLKRFSVAAAPGSDSNGSVDPVQRTVTIRVLDGAD